MAVPKIAVIGAGWSGAAAARCLNDGGIAVEVFEKAAVVGGHSRVEEMDGVVYEPNGPHIFHTSDAEVAAFVHRFGMCRPFAHCPLTEILVDGEPRLFSWPLQLDELRQLPQWGRIRSELDRRTAQPSQENFEDYCVSLTEKPCTGFCLPAHRQQWDIEPRKLSAQFAPKRIDLRRDNDRRLFRDTWQYFPERGVNSIIEAILVPVAVRFSAEILLPDLRDHLHRDFDGAICTSPLDSFAVGHGELAWRGVRSRAVFHPTDDPKGTVTDGYTINRPHERVAFTRSVETKHASGQLIRGTIVCEEYANGEDRHYPVLTADDRNQRVNESLKQFIREQSPIPIWFCGRLANYQYINQDQAIRQGMDAANAIIADLRHSQRLRRGMQT
jgi:UDP-galactopyranose mutase